ncbi:MAG: hypothetical protein ACREUA_09050, partial [Burkholderiales bacterium]
PVWKILAGCVAAQDDEDALSQPWRRRSGLFAARKYEKISAGYDLESSHPRFSGASQGLTAISIPT